MFNVYTVELLDTKEHVYLEYALFADNMESAIECAKEKAYNMISENKNIIRYVSVKNVNEQYVYNVFTKKLEKWY